MNFNDAIVKLDIEEYGKRIFNSNSHGELSHLYDYVLLAKHFEGMAWFKEWFEATIKYAEENWDRPESVFQHIPKMLEAATNNPVKEEG